MKKIYYKMIFKLIFVVVLSVSKTIAYTKIESISLNNNAYPARPTRVYLNPNKLRYYTFMVNLGNKLVTIV